MKQKLLLGKRHCPNWGIKVMASAWTSTHGTRIGHLQRSYITGEHVVTIRDYDWNQTSAELDLQPDASSLTFATHMNSLHLICLYPRKSVSGELKLV